MFGVVTEKIPQRKKFEATGKGLGLKFSLRTPIPNNWCKFLRDSKNKAELFRFFLTDAAVQGMSVLGEVYISDVDNNTVRHVGLGDETVGVFCSYRKNLIPGLWYTFFMQ